MSSTHTSSDRFLRGGLALVSANALLVAVPALLAPRTFFDEFPFVSHWVDLLGSYNEHLTTDTGVLYLAFALLFARAAQRPERALVAPLCAVWGLAGVLHLSFHLTHLDGFPVGDGIAQSLSLLALAALPLLLLRRSVRS